MEISGTDGQAKPITISIDCGMQVYVWLRLYAPGGVTDMIKENWPLILMIMI